MPQFTKEQEKAINDRGHDILVSASAGSGKTTVLVERVLREILSGTRVDELLVVTFTKAAAEEMKTRIKAALTKELDKPKVDRRYLREQLNQIDTANISTIDAFCLDVIHRFYYSIDLDPSFSILTDETQAALLKERALREIEGKFLNDDKNQDFRYFYDNFAGDRDADSPRDLLLDLYDFAMAKPEYDTWLKQLPTAYEIGDNIVESNIWQKQIKPYIVTRFTELQDKIASYLAQPIIETKELAKVKDSFTLFSQNLDNFITSVQNDADYDKQRELLRACVFTINFRKSKKWDEDLLDFYSEIKNLKDEAKDQVFDTFTSFFAVTEKDQVKIMHDGHKIVTSISNAEIELINHFNDMKRKENLLDYSDMEQLAYHILSQNTTSSQMARDFYQNKFKEILIDEYQDINALQEGIIQQIKNKDKNTLFMVGDVKQSIYGFRQAEPSLFLEKYHNFADSSNDHEERILLSDNFRSTEAVTWTVNHLFNSILSTDFGGINYRKEGQLIFGAKYYPESLPQASEVIVHEKKNSKQDETEIDFSEIQMVLARIKHLKEEHVQVFDNNTQKMREVEYSDIAILTRSRNNNLEIMQEFAKQDIPLFVTDAENYFQTFELTVIMNYLKIIDNPDQDIPLVAVLRSPLFNFNEKELAKIRIKSKNSNFYSALTSYVGTNDELSKKCKDFLNQLAELRSFATTHRISELIWSIYEHTNLLEIMTSLPNGEQRRVNLEALYERASSYESAGFKGLYQFINFINRMRRSQKDLAQPLLTKEAGNAVRLMTIHGSKGLEFPIVIYVGMQHHYQMRDLNGNYVINSDGLGITLREEHYRVDSLVKAMGNITKKRQLLEEEARILYVALTRAKQKLILVGDVPSLAKKVNQWSSELTHAGQLPLISKLSATSPLSFIGPALAFDKHIAIKMNDITKSLDQSQKIIFVDYQDSEIQFNKKEESKDVQKDDTNKIDLLTNTVDKLYKFNYPFKDASETTAYQAVSEIKKAFNDPIDAELENSHLLTSTNRYLQPIDTKPNFLYQTKFTGAEIGTATHLILQYYDYTNNSPDNLEQEISKLIEQKKLNPDIISSITKDQIEWFVNSDFTKDFWKYPNNLKREVDFSSLLSAKTLFKDFSDPDAKILVHGTIDGYFVTKNGIILFDYKTDHVDKSHLDKSIELIKEKYTGQLRLYEQALNEFSEKKVISKYLILLDAKQVVKVK